MCLAFLSFFDVSGWALLLDNEEEKMLLMLLHTNAHQ
jgi:hypothetical protein